MHRFQTKTLLIVIAVFAIVAGFLLSLSNRMHMLPAGTRVLDESAVSTSSLAVSRDAVLPGTQITLTPRNFAATLAAITPGNTAVLAPGTYPGFDVPAGVAITASETGTAIVNGNIDCTGRENCTIVGLTINNGFIDTSGTSGARISRNTFHNGFDRNDGFGAGAIVASGASRAQIDHNAFADETGVTVLAWNLDDSSITANTFTNVRQGIDCDFSERGHGNDTFANNYFSGTSRMAIECSSGGDDTFYPAFSNIKVIDNYAENFAWPANAPDGGSVAYSIVGGQGGESSQILGNTALGNGAMSIGIELNKTGVVSGNRIAGMGWACVEVYAESGFTVKDNNLSDCPEPVGNYQNGSGTIENNNTSITPPKPATGPHAR